MKDNLLITEQEKFWAGSFGDDYIKRNQGKDFIATNLAIFAKILSRTHCIESVMEFGCNIGLNLRAIRQLLPQAELSAIEINDQAVEEIKKWGEVKIYHESILNFVPDYQRDFVFTNGVLIHINPDFLPQVYELLYQTSKKYICLAEYYNPTPMEMDYRGYEGKLFKRDFAGELLDKYNNLKLIDYGFSYYRDSNFPGGDLTWFLMEKM